MINDIENLTTGTDTATDMSDGNAMQSDRREAGGLKVRSSIKAGPGSLNHSEARGLKVRSSVKAGGLKYNHSEAKGLLR